MTDHGEAGTPEPSGWRRLVCEAESAGTRLDAYLSKRLRDHSREYLKRLIREGQVTVDGHQAVPSRKLRQGEVVEITVPEPVAVHLVPEQVDLDICYEDVSLLVVNKPRGMLTHPTNERTATGSLVNALLGHCTDLAGINGELRPGIVHRLDRDTSGLLVVAKSDRVHRSLSDQFKARTVRKEYFALAQGAMASRRGRIEWPIGRHPTVRNRMRVDIDRGREARTAYRVVRVFEHASLALIRLHTGRTHQIRVHLAELGHALVGDTLYGGRDQKFVFQGVALHSARLAFVHPSTGEEVACSRPVPPDFQQLLFRAAEGENLTRGMRKQEE